MLQTVQIVTGGACYGVVVSPGVRHLPELLSVKDLTLVHGNMENFAMEIFGLPVILTNINLTNQNLQKIKIHSYDISINQMSQKIVSWRTFKDSRKNTDNCLKNTTGYFGVKISF